ncbi:PD-(D/E)XK nuclease family protein [Shewanella mangrovisoli]|uniref:PD-(D/E)XK nuclease family protein n=1 Tax=Shewanella mangrovisoli TaxID=2864211 RepID=UPI0035B7E19A
MLDSLLVNVSKYAASHQNSPIENFITEVFAWLLREDGAVRTAIADYLQKLGEEKSLPVKPLGDSKQISTQANFNGKFPDMLWDNQDNDFCIIFEHKVWAELHENQLENYRAYARDYLKKPFIVVLITAHSGQHRQLPDLALCWYQIAGVIEKVIAGDDKQKWLREEFVALLKSNGLIEMSPVNPLALPYYFDSKKIDKQLFDIATRTASKNWPILQLTGYEKPPFQRYVRSRFDEWGRIGLEFNRVSDADDIGSWAPGLFCGFMMDGYEHSVKDLMPDEPFALLMIIIDEPLHSHLSTNEPYQQLVASIEVMLPIGWSVSERTRFGRDEDYWNPLIIYRKLSEFIGSATTIEQQSATFFEQMSSLQQSLLGNEVFIAFTNDMQRRYKDK